MFLLRILLYSFYIKITSLCLKIRKIDFGVIPDHAFYCYENNVILFLHYTIQTFDEMMITEMLVQLYITA